MRTIKFKAKRQDNGQWVAGDLLQHLDGDVLIGDNTGPWTDDGYSHCDYHQVCKVNPKTVCQYTGCEDKNEKDIYEGDILQDKSRGGYIYTENSGYYGVIVFDLICKRFVLKTVKIPNSDADSTLEGYFETISQAFLDDFEVIGSIHDKEWQEKLNIKIE